MRQTKSIYVILAFLLLSCSTKKSNVNQVNKDTILKEYLRYSSQLQFYDTTNYNYRILRAYINNDTLFLQQVLTDIATNRKEINNSFPDSIRRHPVLSKLEVDEAYQFNYSETFCDLNFYFTISKKGDSVNLHSVIYKANREPFFLRPSKESQLKLSIKDWVEFENLIDYTDFWELNQYKQAGCCDSDFLTVEAIIRNPFDHRIVKQRKVERRFVSKTALYTAYSLLAGFAKYKKGCD